jgi:cytochrome c biogenesis protein CcdA
MRSLLRRMYAVLGIFAGLLGLVAAVLALVLWGDLGWLQRIAALGMGAMGLSFMLDARREWTGRV